MSDVWENDACAPYKISQTHSPMQSDTPHTRNTQGAEERERRHNKSDIKTSDRHLAISHTPFEILSHFSSLFFLHLSLPGKRCSEQYRRRIVSFEHKPGSKIGSPPPLISLSFTFFNEDYLTIVASFFPVKRHAQNGGGKKINLFVISAFQEI